MLRTSRTCCPATGSAAAAGDRRPGATGLLVLTEHADGRSGDDRNWRWSQVFAENADLMAWPDGAREMVTEADAPPGFPAASR